MTLNLLAVPLPSTRAETYRLTGPRTTRLPAIARDFLADVLPPAAHADPDAVNAAQVCVSELVTNALKHTATATVTVEALIAANRCVVHVHDSSPRPPLQRTWTPDQEHGRGLALVQSYAESWGTWFYGGPSPTRKSVWFRIALPGGCAA